MLKTLINKIIIHKYILFFITVFYIIYRETLFLNFQQDEYHSIVRLISQYQDIGLIKLFLYNLTFLPINEVFYLVFTLIFKGNPYLYNLLNFILTNINILIVYAILNFYSNREILKITILGLIFFNFLSSQIFFWNWAGISYNLGLSFISFGYLIILKNNKIILGLILITLSSLIRPFFVFCFPAILIFLFFEKKRLTLLLFLIFQILIIYLNFFFELKLYADLKSFNTISTTDESRMFLGYSKYFFIRPLIHIGQLIIFNKFYWNIDFNQFIALSLICIYFIYINRLSISDKLNKILILSVSLLTYLMLFNFDTFAKDNIYLESRHYYIPAIFLGIILLIVFDNLKDITRKILIGIIMVILFLSMINISTEISKLRDRLDYKTVLLKEITNNLDMESNNIILIEEKNSSTSYNRFSYNIQTGVIFPILIELFNEKKLMYSSVYDKNAWGPEFEGFIELEDKKLGIFFDIEKMTKEIQEKLISDYNLVRINIDYDRKYEVDYSKTDLENTRLDFIF